MSKQIFSKESSASAKKTVFWKDVTKYTHASKDESFVEEVAYLMVTLHKTGA